MSSPLVSDVECLSKCRSVIHGSKIVSALTRRQGIELLSYIRFVCSNYAHVTDKLGRNALHMAASCGQKRVLKWLLERDHCDPNVKDLESGWTALHRSLYYGQLTAAKLLIDNGADFQIRDNCGYTPLDLVVADRVPYVEYSKLGACDAYVWGCNSNFNLGREQQQSRSAPEIVDYFKREKLSVKQVKMCKYHTLFVTHDGRAFSCGHGQGGRLGQDSEGTVIIPKEIKALSFEKCEEVAAGSDHSVFLMRNGTVYTCGDNTYHQLGHAPPPEHLLTPKVIKSLRKLHVIGTAASRFHTALYTNDALYTFGLNGGQLGHMKGEKVIAPRQISAINCRDKETTISQICTSDGATVCVTNKGDIFAMTKYQCKKIAKRLINMKMVAAVGGQLDYKVKSDELKDNGGSELKIFILMNNGSLLVWEENSGQITRCVIDGKMQPFILDFCPSRTNIILLTNDWQGYIATIKTRCNKKMTGSVIGENYNVAGKKDKKFGRQDSFTCSGTTSQMISKCADKDSYEVLSLERLPGIHRGVLSSCDPKGENFAVVQGRPALCVFEQPVINPSGYYNNFILLLENSDSYDPIHDVIIQVSDETFPAHKYILSCRSEYFCRLFLGQLTDMPFTRNEKLVIINDVHPEIFRQILKYIYTNSCGFLEFGYQFPNSLIYQWEKQFKEKRSSRDKDPDKLLTNYLIKKVQDAARIFGLHTLHTKMESVTIRNGKIIEAPLRSEMSVFDRKKFSYLWDVSFVCEDGNEIRCHKCILVARLEYFCNMFANPWIESTVGGSLKFPIPSNFLEVVIDFLYTDTAPNLQNCDNVDFVSKILVLSEQFMIDRLKQMCENSLGELVTLKNATEILEFAYTYNAKQLQATCMEYICLNLAAILENKSFNNLSEEVLDLFTKYYRDLIPSMDKRFITPYWDSPTEEDIKTMAGHQPLLDDDEDDLSFSDVKNDTFNSSKKQKVKRKPRSHRNSQTQPLSPMQNETIELECEEINKKGIQICEPGRIAMSEPVPIPAPSCQRNSSEITLYSPISNSSFTPPTPSPRSLESDSFKWHQTPSSQSLNLKDIMNEQKKDEKQNCGKTKPSDFRITNKLSQKQRKKLSASGMDVESPTPKSTTNTKPINPWGRVEPKDVESLSDIMKHEFDISKDSLQSSPTEPINCYSNSSREPNPWSRTPKLRKEAVNFADIVQAEQKQCFSLKKLQSKPLHLIQLEEQAIQELTKHYTAEGNDDEIVTVQRISIQAQPKPIWKVAHK